MITIILPLLNEEKYISRCLDSVLSQDYPLQEMEILLIDGMSEDDTRLIVRGYQEKYSAIKLIDNPSRTVPYAMNIGIKTAKGDVIIRMDAHAEYPSNYLSSLCRQLSALQADNVGCEWKTDVLHKNAKSLAIREVLCNRFGVGNSTFRLGCSEVKQVDTVPFGCFPKKTFDTYGLFDERLSRNQDIEMNKRIIRKGGKIFLVPDTYCTYYARETYKDLIRNNFSNGMWNILTVYYTHEFNSLSIRHFVPLAFALSIFFCLAFSLIHVLPLILLLGVYSCLIGIISLLLSYKKKLNFFYLFVTFPILHISYGIGSMVGILRILFNRV